jgi:hypothetical protein
MQKRVPYVPYLETDYHFIWPTRSYLTDWEAPAPMTETRCSWARCTTCVHRARAPRQGAMQPSCATHVSITFTTQHASLLCLCICAYSTPLPACEYQPWETPHPKYKDLKQRESDHKSIYKKAQYQGQCIDVRLVVSWLMTAGRV